MKNRGRAREHGSVTNMSYIHLTAILTIVFVDVVLGDSGCKTDVLKYCYKRDFQVPSDRAEIVHTCRRRTKTTAVQCAEDVQIECEEEFNHPIDPTGWLEGLQLYCHNSKLLSENVGCLNAATTGVQNCVQEMWTIWSQKMISRNITIMTDTRVTLRFTCEQSRGHARCVQRFLAKTCPLDVQRIVNDVNMLMTGPFCPLGGYGDGSVLTSPTEATQPSYSQSPQHTSPSDAPPRVAPPRVAPPRSQHDNEDRYPDNSSCVRLPWMLLFCACVILLCVL